MKKIKALEAIQKDQLLRIFVKAKEVITSKSYKYLQGVYFASNLLIIDIDENQSIHIDFSDHTILLVSNQDFSSKKYGSQNEITILSWFISELLSIGKDKTNRSLLSNLFGTLKGSGKTPNLSTTNSIDLFFQVELRYYKSLLSGHITIYCFKKDGQYSFDLPNGKVFLAFISDYSSPEKNIYLIQRIGHSITTFKDEADCKQEVLAACKYLTSNPDLLKPK